MNKALYQKIPQVVSQEVCLKCEGCCRFKEENSCWRPKVSDSEIDGNREALKSAIDKDGYVLAKKQDNVCLCVFLNSITNKCELYGHRPFECRLYPLMLVKRDSKVWVSAHLSCPYIQEIAGEESFSEYVSRVKEYFSSEEIKQFLKENVPLIGNYSQSSNEFIDLFCIDEIDIEK